MLSFKVADKPIILKAELAPTQLPPPSTGLLHRYAANLRLTELIDQYDASGSEEDRSAVVDLSLAASIISPLTAFVGLRPKELQNRGKISVKIPIGKRKHMSVDYLDGVPLCPPPG